jgi:hypothetical protein
VFKSRRGNGHYCGLKKPSDSVGLEFLKRCRPYDSNKRKSHADSCYFAGKFRLANLDGLQKQQEKAWCLPSLTGGVDERVWWRLVGGVDLRFLKGGRARSIQPVLNRIGEDVVDQGVHPGGGRQAQLQGGLLAHHRRQGIHTSLSFSSSPGS